jgi:hypothetical protein
VIRKVTLTISPASGTAANNTPKGTPFSPGTDHPDLKQLVHGTRIALTHAATGTRLAACCTVILVSSFESVLFSSSLSLSLSLS